MIVSSLRPNLYVGSVRGGVGVTQDVSVFEILGVGTHLKVLFEGFLALDGGEGRRVDGWGGVWVGHGVGVGLEVVGWVQCWRSDGWHVGGMFIVGRATSAGSSRALVNTASV